MTTPDPALTPHPSVNPQAAQKLAHDTAHDAAKHTVTMPGSKAQNEMAIRAVSPEGEPADPKAGPRGIRLIMLGGIAIIIIAALAGGFWIGWPAALAIAGLAAASLAFNPILWAGTQRAKDREVVLEQRQESGELPLGDTRDATR